MNKRLIALMGCAVLVFTSMTAFAQGSLTIGPAVDVIASATSSEGSSEPTEAPSAPSTPSKPSTPVVFTETSADINRLLALNSVGGDVALLQTLLNEAGYSLKVDGIFGPKTLAAVEDFQGKNGLRVDGIVGPKTLAVLAPAVEEAPEVEEPAEPVEPELPEEPAEEEVDVVTTASIVADPEAFEKAMGTAENGGTWIIAALNDITIEKEIVLEGDFENRGTPARKIALYTQDDDRNVLEQFTLTAPKLTVKSPYARIQNGTFKGDIYVEAPNFRLVGATVDGVVYFTNQEAKDSFDIDENSSVKGLVLIDVDATATASVVASEADFEKAIGTAENGGTWIAALLKDMKFNKTLTLEGEHENRGAAARKIALYTQDENRNIVKSFTLTAPKLFINSPNARIQGGTFIGNLYVEVPNFQLVKAKVNGNVYFTSQEAKDSFKMDDASEVTGVQEVIDVDAIATASVVYDLESFEKAISKHGKWIICLESDITTENEIVLDGTFMNGKIGADGSLTIQRKIALYNYDENRNVGDRFTLTAPKLTIKSPNARLQYGTFVGDLYVEAPNFQLVGTKVEGNIYFASEEIAETFKIDDASEVTGVREVK